VPDKEGRRYTTKKKVKIRVKKENKFVLSCGNEQSAAGHPERL
jgi:hypothetical protein